MSLKSTMSVCGVIYIEMRGRPFYNYESPFDAHAYKGGSKGIYVVYNGGAMPD